MTIKSLAELCLQLCQKHIGQLTSFGDGDVLVPPHYVREILLRVTDPAQLRQIEINSPYIDTSGVWKRLITKEFPVESRDKDYTPPTPAKWSEVYERYFNERQISQMKAEEQLRRRFQGLQEQKDSRVSKLVDQRFLPRPPKTGRSHGVHTKSFKGFSNPSSWGNGGKSKAKSGPSILRKVRREAAEHALMRGVLATRPRTLSPGTTQKVSASIVQGRRIAAGPASTSRHRPSTRSVFRVELTADAGTRNIVAQQMAPRTQLGSRRSHVNVGFDGESQRGGDLVEKPSNVAIPRSPAKPLPHTSNRQCPLSNGPKIADLVVLHSSDRQSPTESSFAGDSSTLQAPVEPSARVGPCGPALQFPRSPERPPLPDLSSVPSLPAPAQCPSHVLGKRRKHVNIFMPAIKRGRF